MPLPVEIAGLRSQAIRITWEDNHESIYAARELRLQCRCAYCLEETSGRPLLDPSQVPLDVIPIHIELVGQYAMLIHWSDNHTTSIYRFRWLRDMCMCSECTSSSVSTRL